MEKVNVILDPASTHGEELTLCPNFNLYTGKNQFETEFGEVTSLEEDLLNLGAVIFGTDLAIRRGQREQITRNIELTIPVVNLPTFRSISEEIRYALYILSHDAWKINFVQSPGQPEATRDWGSQMVGKVLLFSGGLDSFSAAVKLGDAHHDIQLVSHVTANPVVSKTQEELFTYLDQTYPHQFQRNAFRVSGISKPSLGLLFPSDKNREETQRTRSFMFLSLAGLVARRRGYKDIVMIAENGQMAIHLPLSAARISAFSTHTAHPSFVSAMSKILSTILNYQISIENPFLYLTKAEVIKDLFPQHKSSVEKTVSCWKASRVSHFNHCGICIPCLVRRIAIEKNGYSFSEYEHDLLNDTILALGPDDEGKRNLVELCEFISVFLKDKSLAELMQLYPELANSDFDITKAVGMYKRFANEAMQVFQNYPQVISLME